VKSTVAEIRDRFDNDVERFSNLETGQSATIDAPLALDLIAEAAAVTNPRARRLLDVGCGAGNYSVKFLQRLPGLEVTLLDLSGPMLERAQQRTLAAGASTVRSLQEDIREVVLDEASFDLIVAAAVFHHLRTDDEWWSVFTNLFRSLSAGGSLWVFDLVECEVPALRAATWRRYGEYLESLKGPAYRDEVLAYIKKEDTPRSLTYQIDLLRQVGFSAVEVLHKHGCFAAFGAVRDSTISG
jgi:tRNA (cmo5U34)-methyltransferase